MVLFLFPREPTRRVRLENAWTPCRVKQNEFLTSYEPIYLFLLLTPTLFPSLYFGKTIEDFERALFLFSIRCLI